MLMWSTANTDGCVCLQKSGILKFNFRFLWFIYWTRHYVLGSVFSRRAFWCLRIVDIIPEVEFSQHRIKGMDLVPVKSRSEFQTLMCEPLWTVEFFNILVISIDCHVNGLIRKVRLKPRKSLSFNAKGELKGCRFARLQVRCSFHPVSFEIFNSAVSVLWCFVYGLWMIYVYWFDAIYTNIWRHMASLINFDTKKVGYSSMVKENWMQIRFLL